MSDENQEYETPRQILLLQQMMQVVGAAVQQSTRDLIEPRHFMSSFAHNPTATASRENYKNGAGFLDQAHELARECARNCFLSVDITKYDEELRKNLAILVREYKDCLPEKMQGFKKQLSEFLDRTEFANVTGNFEQNHFHTLMDAIRVQTHLHLQCGKDTSPQLIMIESDYVPAMLKRMIGGIAGFGQTAAHVPREIEDAQEELFGFAVQDLGWKFVRDLSVMINCCPEASRHALAEQIGMGADLEGRLQKTMKDDPQQLYMVGQISNEALAAMTKFCKMVGVQMPNSFESPIQKPITAILAACVSMRKNGIESLDTDFETLPQFINDAVALLTRMCDVNEPIFAALVEYNKRLKTPPVGVTQIGGGGSLSDAKQSPEIVF